MLIHAMHNGISTLLPMVEHWPAWTGLTDPEASRLPFRVVLTAAILFILGLALLVVPTHRAGESRRPRGVPPDADPGRPAIARFGAGGDTMSGREAGS